MISLATLGFPSLTPLPSFNSWALSMAAWRTGEMEEATLSREFARFQLEMSQISTVFRSEVRFQEPSDRWMDLIDEALYRLEICEDQTFLLGEKAGASWDLLGDEQVQTAARALTSLFEVFQQLKELEEKRPRLAASPYIHEVLRCAQLYEKGVLAADLMQERLTGVSHHFQTLGEQLRQTPVRLPAVEQLLDLLEIQEGALQDLSERLAQGQKALPDELKRVLRDCAEQALTIHQEIQTLSGSPAVWCDGCLGLVRLTPEELCPECGQPVAPEETEEAAGWIEIAERACEQNRPEDWDLLPPRAEEARLQAQELAKKSKLLPEKKPALEQSLTQLVESLSELCACLPARDGRALSRLLPALRDRMERANEMQEQMLEEMQGG